jgi:superfamily II DNA or RNA helicase
MPYTHEILSFGTGSGKPVMALNIIAERKQSTLIIVHTKELLHQWVERAGQFLGIAPEKIGIIGAGKFTLGNQVTVERFISRRTFCQHYEEEWYE